MPRKVKMMTCRGNKANNNLNKLNCHPVLVISLPQLINFKNPPEAIRGIFNFPRQLPFLESSILSNASFSVIILKFLRQLAFSEAARCLCRQLHFVSAKKVPPCGTTRFFRLQKFRKGQPASKSPPLLKFGPTPLKHSRLSVAIATN